MPALALRRRLFARPFSVGIRESVRALLSSLVLLGVSAGTAQAREAPRVQLATSMGNIVLELDVAAAPLSAANFLEYVDAGFYDGTIFHRVIEGFMIQGGGFGEDFMKKRTRTPIRNEASNGLANRRYSIAMARTSDPHSATAQFFINDVDNRNLDHTAPTPRGWGYTVFGRVVDGFETVDAIAELPTGSRGPFGRDVPVDTVSILKATRLDQQGTPATDAPGTPSAPVSLLPADVDDAQAGAIN